MPGRSLPARLVGAIRLTRHLRLPPARWEAAVEALEASEIFRQWAAHILSARLPGAEVDASLPVEGAIGQFQWRDGRIRIVYRHPAWGREYVWEREGLPFEAQGLLRELRLVSTRSRLTHLMLTGLAQRQRAYLDSGDVLDLEPFSQAALGEWATLQGSAGQPPVCPSPLPKTIDPSLISRAARGISLLTPQGQVVSLRQLMPSSRAVLLRRLQALLDEEAAGLRRGLIERPADDEALRARLAERWGIHAARRTVALARQTLGVPASYRRDGRHPYPPRGLVLSSACPLTAAALRDRIPARPGVYEVALTNGEVYYPDGASPVIYLGRSRNLRKRLADHLRPSAKNAKLGAYLTGVRCVVRYLNAPVAELHTLERALAQAFVDAYGALPISNRIRP